MAIIKCKMCGGDIALNEEKTFGTCEYCGSTMTLPTVSDDQRAARFNRGNHFRRQGEFDKALAVYESIVREDDADAEAHWCCALCRFGIEYVEDPNTFEYLPTCHRASFDSFLEDVDYKAALENSDGITRRQYQKDATRIAEVQRGILATSQNEEPFDVFICYKETDDETKARTRDSIDAQEIYYQLTQEGYRVFFSRITLEDKAGTEYEPYIFAALNSAKVMVAIGSKPEYFNAVWVKNEWSRFLAMMRKDRSKLLLPCYKNMDPYDLPEQLGVLQSYDMTKIGFVQDLIRGIKKVLAKDEQKPEPVKETVVVRESTASTGPSTANLVRRGNIFLEEQNWTSAEEYFNKALDIDAENAEAYLGLTLANAKCKNLNEFALQCSARFTEETEESLEACEPETDRINALACELEVLGYLTAEAIRKTLAFSRSYPSREASARQNREKTMSALRSDRNYTRAKQFAAETLKQRLTEAEQAISGACDQRIENAKREADAAKETLAKQYLAYLDKQEQSLRERSQKAQEQREADYQQACQRQEKAIIEEDYRAAAQAFAFVVDYKDANDRARQARMKADELKAEKENRIKWAKQERTKKKKRARLFVGIAVVLGVIALIVTITVIIPNNMYNAALKLYEDGKYQEAIEAFEVLIDYKDSREQIEACKKDLAYQNALVLKDSGDYERAIEAFKALKGYKDSVKQIKKCETAIMDPKYEYAMSCMLSGNYEEAIDAFEALNGYKDSNAKIEECKIAISDLKYERAIGLKNSRKDEEAVKAFEELDGYKDSEEQIIAIKDSVYEEAVQMMEAGEYDRAIKSFDSLEGYKDSLENIVEIKGSDEWRKACQIGDTVFFGTYEQDNDLNNGAEDIEWIVLEKEEDKLFVISKCVLDWQPYNKSSYGDIRWSTCTLRKWMNESFLSDAFSIEEQERIPSTKIRVYYKNKSGYWKSEFSEDKVFILSSMWDNKYLSSCAATDYAIAQGARVSSGNSDWWLGETIISYAKAEFVNWEGEESTFSKYVDSKCGVRPAMWINIEP